MRLRLLIALAVVAGVVAAGALAAGSGRSAERAAVAYVVDGDTIALAGGVHVRLLQVDATELGSGECYSRRATKELRRLLPEGSSVGLLADPRLDRVDRYGRLLRYVFRGGTNVNVALVARGAATVWFYGGVKGRFAGALLDAARRARAARRGVWGACDVIWNPYQPATIRHHGRRPSTPHGRCDSSYPTVCIPPPPPDLDCSDVRYRRFKVLPPDPHHFDGDHDGVGCERD